MARRSAENPSSQSPAPAERSPLHAEDDDGILSFGDGDFSDDTVIDVTDEVLALLGSIALPGSDAGLEASLGWNFFVFG